MAFKYKVLKKENEKRKKDYILYGFHIKFLSSKSPIKNASPEAFMKEEDTRGKDVREVCNRKPHLQH